MEDAASSTRPSYAMSRGVDPASAGIRQEIAGLDKRVFCKRDAWTPGAVGVGSGQPQPLLVHGSLNRMGVGRWVWEGPGVTGCGKVGASRSGS